MSKFRTRNLALVLSAAAVAAAGCGSSSSSKSKPASPAASTPATPSTPGTTGTTGTTATSPAAFSAQLNTLCKQFIAAPDSQTAAYVAKFKSLMPTAQQKADYEKFLASVEVATKAKLANNQDDLKKAAQDNEAAAKALNAPECLK